MRSLEDVADNIRHATPAGVYASATRGKLAAKASPKLRELWRIGHRVYLCGPMSGLPDLNHHAFHRAQGQLEARGFEVVSPARLVTDGRAWHLAMRVCLHHLVTCDQIALLPGWPQSKGARRELEVAHDCEIPVRMLWEYL
jgi:hypothetical protein